MPEDSPSVQKKVDESWKDSVAKEKGSSSAGAPEPAEQESAFSYFLSTLGMQALAALGELEDPATGGPARPNLPQAKYLIDTLQLLEEKSRNNRTPEEESMLQNLLYELRMKFVQKNAAR